MNVVGLVGESKYSDADIEKMSDTIAGLVAGGFSLEGAQSALSYAPADLIFEGRSRYEKKRGLIREISDPGALVEAEVKKGFWYSGPREDDKIWPALKTILDSELPSAAVEAIDRASSKVIGLGKPPGQSPISSRGLVLGYVQSGKTTNFMSVIAKAGDVGYRLIIVLTGTTENLRNQTQERIDSYLIEPCGSTWNPLTTAQHDFCETTSSDAVLSSSSMRSIAVVKKNPSRLRRLRNWIRTASSTTLKDCPILVIDDEADQASIDVGTKRQSTINKLIQEILDNPKAGYIAYTATPFANLLIDPSYEKDLYPRDFIVDLPRPENYFGAERIFGKAETASEGESPDDGLDVVRTIPEFEIEEVRPPKGKDAIDGWVPEIPESMRKAVQWFLLATSARRLRAGKVAHSSMLVHTSMLAAAHMKTAGAVEDCLEDLRASLVNESVSALQEFRDLWESECLRVPAADFGHDQAVFEDLAGELLATARATRVVVDNYLSTDRLYYSKTEPQTVIVVGGNTLSRGLTLEGLTSSFFVRASSAYDTLLQMGRWFGYRVGYEDLIRIWMTSELQNWFLMLSIVEAEIRQEIEVYEKEGKTPADLPVKIRTHPQMSVTSASKMRQAVNAQVSYSGRRVQTILFREDDRDWLEGNIVATRELFSRLIAEGHSENELDGAKRGFRDVSADLILQFVDAYQLHENAQSIDKSALRKYIERERAEGSLERWDVVLMEPSDGPKELDLGLSTKINMMRRQKMYLPGLNNAANLKAVASTADRIADLDVKIDTIRESLGLKPSERLSDAQLAAVRKLRGKGQSGLLCIYPISKSSHPDGTTDETKQINRRVPLNAAEHLVGVCFMFPHSPNPQSAVDYIFAKVDPDYLEDLGDELARADELDETRAEQDEMATA